MSGHIPDDANDDATIVRTRAAAGPAAGGPRPARPGVARPAAPEINAFPGSDLNPLLQAAHPLLLLAVQLRHSATVENVEELRGQVQTHIRRFDSHMQEARVHAPDAIAGRYVLCAMVDEAVLGAKWGERSSWSQKTLLVTFHGEAYGGAKFFQLLERLMEDVPRHIDLLELMYACLVLGFAGRYQIEAGGRARLAEIQDDLYRRIRSQRGQPAADLSPHWHGIQDRRSPLMHYVPLWIGGAVSLCLLVGVFIGLHSRLSALASPISAAAAQIGLQTLQPPASAVPAPRTARETLKQLLTEQETAGVLEVNVGPAADVQVRLRTSRMFESGDDKVAPGERALIEQVGDALEKVPGRIVVVGHTDDLPIRSLRFSDNYELSAARAQAVADVIGTRLNDPGRMEVVGAGASQPIALPPTLPGNRDRNRRVDILFEPGE